MSQNIIVIHPGSLYLRIGRASDLNPQLILHCIARRRKKHSGVIYNDSILPTSVNNKTKELFQEMEECRLSVSHTLQSCFQSDGRRRYGTPTQQISAFNKRSLPEIIIAQEQYWANPSTEFVIGADVLRLDPNGDFNLHFPMRRGEFNIHKNIGGSMISVLEDLKCIWEYVIKHYLEIDLKDLNQYKAVLVIPDIYNRKQIKEMTALLYKMGLSACFLVQEHVSATFGSGLSYACVVDIGDQKISISCVEDGISHSNTRVCLKYGGADITMAFFWLLQKAAFPYKECQSKNPQDAMLLMNLKENYCHIDMDVCGSQEKSFVINRPEQSPVRYVLQVADELLVAPLSLFNTELLKLTLGKTNSNKIIQIQATPDLNQDAEDCFDSEFLRETGRRVGSGNTGYLKDQIDNSMNINDSNTGDVNDDDIVVDDLEQKRNCVNDFQMPAGQVIGLDNAILQSIEHLHTDELKRKMFSSILLIGGSSKFPGLNKWLQNRITLQIPFNYKTDQQDIVHSPKEIDAAQVSWRGAAVLSGLESAEELWIATDEYSKHGVRILREKCPFVW